MKDHLEYTRKRVASESWAKRNLPNIGMILFIILTSPLVVNIDKIGTYLFELLVYLGLR